ADTIELDLLLASGSSPAELDAALGGANVSIRAIPSKHQTVAPKDTAPPVRAPRAISDAIRPMRADAAPHSERAAAIEAQREAPELRVVAQTVRVDTRKLDALMNVVGELAIVKNTLGRVAERLRAEGNRQLGSELHSIQRSFDRRLSELQGGILEVRMVPL